MLKAGQDQEPGTRHGRFLRRWVAGVQSRPKLTLILSIVMAVVAALYSLASLGFKTNRTDLVHPSQDSARDWNNFTKHFGEETDIIVVVAGTDQPTMIAAIETIARDISSFPNHFEKLCYRIRTDGLKAKGLYQLSPSQLREIRDRLESFSPLLVGAWDWMSVDNFLRATRFRLASLTLEEPLESESRRAVESAARLLESLSSFVSDSRIYRSPWQGLFNHSREQSKALPEYFFSPDGKLALLRVAPIRDESSFNGLREPVGILRQTVARTQAAFPTLQIGLTGVPILEDDEMTSAKSASTQSMLLSVIGITVLFIIAFRAWKHPLFAVGTLLISACWTLGWVTLTVGHLSVLSVSFIVTLIGLGIDFSILWISRFESELALGFDAIQANQNTACWVGPGIVVGALTTALSFFTTMATDLLGLREMGWIAGSGILFCLLGSLTVLPALLALESPTLIAPKAATRDKLPAMPWIYKQPALIVAAFSVMFCWLFFQTGRVRFDYNLLNLQAKGLSSVEWEERLIRETGTSGWYALSMANSAEEARRLKDAFESLQTVGRVVEIASLIPHDQPEKVYLVQRIHDLVANVPAVENSPKLATPKTGNLIAQLKELEGVRLPNEPGNRILVQRLIKSARETRTRLESLDASAQSQRVADFEALWFRDLLEQLNTLKSVSEPSPVTVADLPGSLRERYYNPEGKWLLQVFAKESIWDLEPLKRFHEEVATVDPHATGKPISTMHALVQMTDGYRKSSLLASVVIFLAVFFDVRSLKLTVLALVPLVLGIITMFGLMGVYDIPLNPANMIALPLVLGIGVDFGVHVVHDFRETQGPYKLNWRLARALLMTSLTTIIGFSSLMIAQHFGMMSIGLVLAIGVGACTVCVLLFLPAVLNLVSRGREENDSTETTFKYTPDPGSTVDYIPPSQAA